MKKSLAAVAAMLFTLSTATTSAEGITGDGQTIDVRNGAGWFNACVMGSEPSELCVAFVTGVLIGASQEGLTRFGICLPRDYIFKHLAKQYARYLRTNPDKLQWNSGSLVMMSLQKKFPCNPKVAPWKDE